MTTFGKKLELARKAKELNKSELARSVGLTPQRITQIEAGTGEMKVEPFLKALAVLEVNSDYFIHGTELDARRSAKQSNPEVNEVVKLMTATDETGRAIVLSHVKLALLNYSPQSKRKRAR